MLAGSGWGRLLLLDGFLDCVVDGCGLALLLGVGPDWAPVGGVGGLVWEGVGVQSEVEVGLCGGDTLRLNVCNNLVDSPVPPRP